MFYRKLPIWIFILALILPACRPVQTAKPTAQPFANLGDEWAIKLTQSGGIMGMERSVEVTSDGNIQIEDPRRSQNSSDGTLSPAQLAELVELVNSSKLEKPKEPSAVCADCFIYDLEITNNGQTFSIQLNDTSLTGSGLEPLVSFLVDLMDGA